ncbi:MAG TPA: hypothetical protein VJN29_08515, partial [Intrasporangium sp.]|uniref:hypothetical protein n=1 Tax=Intrasporangium sp. TaxID=1925024 RepID=UPI002B485E0A
MRGLRRIGVHHVVHPDDGRRPPCGRRRRLAGTVLVVTLSVVLMACQGGPREFAPPTAATNEEALAWTEQPLPGGMDAVTLASAGDALVIGAWAP